MIPTNTAVQQPVAEQPTDYLFKPLSQPMAETAIPEIISHPVSVGRNVRRPAEIQIRDISYVMQAIKQGFYEGYNLKKGIGIIRDMSDKEAARNAKSTLPWFSPSLFDGRRANENFKSARFMVFDIDHVGVPANANSPLPNVASASDGTPCVPANANSPQGLANSDLPKSSQSSVTNDSVVSANSEIGRPYTSFLRKQESPERNEIPGQARDEGVCGVPANANSPLPNVALASDGTSAIESLKSLVIAKLPYLRYAFRSVNDGVKLVAQFSRDITNERDYCKIYVFLAMQIEWAVKRICDNTHDPARACFLSYDPALLINHQVKPLDPRITLKQAEEVMKLNFPKGTTAGVPANANSPLGVGKLLFTPKQAQPAVSGNSIASANSEIGSPVVALASDGTDYAKAEKVIAKMCQIPIVYSDWIKIGQALYAGFGENGKPLWDMFINNPNYSDTQRILDTHWRSFRNVKSIKLGSLFYVADKYGVRYE